jgi:carboxypeptidase Q
MFTRRAFCSLIIVVLLGSYAFTGASIVVAQSETEKLINAARFLEEKPLDKQAREVRAWSLSWIIATDKVTVNICSMALTGLDKKYDYTDELFGLYTVAMAAFKLANPDKAGDEDAAQLAGIQSMMLAYEAILKAKPKAKNAFMDDLISKRASNTLAEHVKANNCKENK